MLLLPSLPSALIFLYPWAGLKPQVHTDTFSLEFLPLFCCNSLSGKEILLQAALAAALGALLRVLLQHPQKIPLFLPLTSHKQYLQMQVFSKSGFCTTLWVFCC